MKSAQIKHLKLTQRIKEACQFTLQRDALSAIFIQGIALLITICLVKVSVGIMPFALPIASLFILQSLISVVLSSSVNTKSWWIGIHALFPISVGVMLIAGIPKEIYLGLFILTSGIFWTTYQSQVPFYPSKQSLYPLLHNLLPKDRPIRMIDIGSGLGGVSLALAKRNPASHFEGIEIAPIPWLLSIMLAKIKRSNVQFKLGNYYDLDFAHYDVIFAYLSPAVTSELWKKAQQEMQIGSLLISHEFPILNVTPSQIVQNASNQELTYVYRISI